MSLVYKELKFKLEISDASQFYHYYYVSELLLIYRL